jgi:hypothetical protein
MSVEDTIPVRDAVDDPLPYFIKDGRAVVERARFDAVMARVRRRRREAETM